MNEIEIQLEQIGQLKLTALVNGYLDGEIADWPDLITDPLLKLIEKREKVNGVTYVIVRSYCVPDEDYRKPSGEYTAWRLFVECIEEIKDISGTVH